MLPKVDLAVWPWHEQSPAAARVTSQVHYANLDPDNYNDQYELVNRQVIASARTGPEGEVEFEFRVPRAEQQLQWQLTMGFYCQAEARTTRLTRGPQSVSYVAGLREWWDSWCWFGCKEKTDPPKPPDRCDGCTPLPRPKLPKTDKYAPPPPEKGDWFRS